MAMLFSLCYRAFIIKVMYKTLGECKQGEFVILWCIGTNQWDDDVVQVVEAGSFPRVKYRSGHIDLFSPSTKCKLVSF